MGVSPRVDTRATVDTMTTPRLLISLPTTVSIGNITYSPGSSVPLAEALAAGVVTVADLDAAVDAAMPAKAKAPAKTEPAATTDAPAPRKATAPARKTRPAKNLTRTSAKS